MNKALVRGLFPVTQRLVYLNHAAVGPLSTRAHEAMQRHATDQRDFGALHWREWYHEYELFREGAARLINAGPDEIAILKNTSEGLSFVAEGMRWERGENVITTDLEFPSNFTPWKALERRGVECRVVESRDGAYTVEDVAALIDANTRLITVSSHGISQRLHARPRCHWCALPAPPQHPALRRCHPVDGCDPDRRPPVQHLLPRRRQS